MPSRKTRPSTRRLTVASLFAGGGGWEVGAVEAGLQPVWASELQESIAQAHDAALPGSHVYVGDVTLLSPDDVQPVDVLCVSPPCQGYSWARVSKTALHEREDLLVGLEAAKFIRKLRPQAVLMENVTKYKDSETFAQLLQILRDEGYHVDYQSVGCQNYGVPSTRRRLIVRATLNPLPPWPAKQKPIPTWDDAIGDLIPSLPAAKPLAAWQVKSLTLCPPPAGVDLLISGGGGSFCAPEGPDTGRLSDRVKKAWQEPGRPGPTMVASAKNMSGYRVLRADGKVVRFTPRCAARIQSFPDWYPLPSDALAFKIVGNAVPPALARIMIESILPACR